MKKLINNFTGKEDYFLNYNEAAEHLQMNIGRLKYLYTDDCKLHPDFLPKRSVHNSKFGFWLKDMDHYKNTKSHLIPKKKPKVAEKTKSAEIIKLSKS
ncbi:hypothetical protein OAS47_03985 [Pelagibacteraceae bacterium]|jgi:hypothetical protein|nr:hypothetical protein [Pelagibacteraceae bacterium]